MFIQANIPAEFHALATVLLCVLMFSAVSTDIRQHRIPNHLVIMVLLLGLFSQLAVDLDFGVIFWAGGLAVGLAIFLLFYIGGGMGAGDVKLMAAISAFLGPLDGAIACGFVLLAGLPLAVGYFIADKMKTKELVDADEHWHPRKSYGTAPEVKHYLSKSKTVKKKRGLVTGEGSKQRIPYAAAIATGTVIGLWWSGRFDQLAGVLLP
jgi:prepilin peptidase CpaA